MNWRGAFGDYLRLLGEWWVSDQPKLGAESAIAERIEMQRKKETLNVSDARIQKALIRAAIDRVEEKREDTVIDYRLLNQWFVHQNDQFYLEERLEPRQAVIRRKKIAADHLKMIGDDQPEPEPLSIINEDRTASETAGRLYNRLQAVRYAETWWNKRNPAYPSIENDCTNYISQCLYAGGIAMSGAPIRGRGWWQQKTNWSFSWTVANSLRWYLSKSGNSIGARETDRADQLVPGDLICYDFEGDGHWNHNTIVTALDPAGQPLVNAHTYDCRNRPWPYTDSPAWTNHIQYKFFHIEDGQ
ncbi:MAG: amidase domain-containing protein [Sporolactobacillus sp.]